MFKKIKYRNNYFLQYFIFTKLEAFFQATSYSWNIISTCCWLQWHLLERQRLATQAASPEDPLVSGVCPPSKNLNEIQNSFSFVLAQLCIKQTLNSKINTILEDLSGGLVLFSRSQFWHFSKAPIIVFPQQYTDSPWGHILQMPYTWPHLTWTLLLFFPLFHF